MAARQAVPTIRDMTTELPERSQPGAVLTAREREVMSMASSGLTNNEIALRLHVSVHGVKFHLASVYRKLGVANRTEAAVTFLQAYGFPETTEVH